MNRKNSVLFCVFFLCVFFRLNAQASYLAPEIERLEGLALNTSQKHDALTQLGRLYQLSGNREKAYESWSAAVNAVSGSRDDTAYLEAIKLLISMGEYEKAAADLRTIIASSRDESIVQSALYLSAQIDVFENNDPEALTRMAGNSAYTNERSRIYYTLWRATGDSAWQASLASSFPRSPEAAIASNGNRIIAALTPLWLFLPSREHLAAASAPTVSTSTPAASASPANPAGAGSADASSAMLQTGLFSKESNAQALAQRLTNAGFNAHITPRRVNGVDYWAVTVPSGPNANRTIADLKAAGFDAFPVN